MIKVKVPATSANLGPGYDSFGLALNLFNVYTFSQRKDKKFNISIKDSNNQIINLKKKNNLILKTISKMKDCYSDKIETKGLNIEVKLNYPLDRGLGSSANAIIGTLCGINELFSLKLSKKKIIDLALKIEGHPDNIVPALHGGFTISQIEEGHLYYEKFFVSPKINVLLFIPNLEIKTKDARKMIGAKINIDDASQNIANASLITAGFIKNDLNLIKKGSKDYIHQQKRLSLNNKLKKFFDEISKNIDTPFFLSGSGSTIIFLFKKDFTKKEEIIKNIAKDLGIVNYLIETKVNKQGIIINEVGD
ncbi:MAG: homoserine kinase [Halanaerobiales bacterium]|nr:homoserine kinase [Halanaerobiales bacterium]